MAGAPSGFDRDLANRIILADDFETAQIAVNIAIRAQKAKYPFSFMDNGLLEAIRLNQNVDKSLKALLTSQYLASL